MSDKTVDKQEQIIKIAMQLFAVKGSSSTSMQEIAELCGISKGSLYLVFKSKEELERSIFLYCYRMIRDPLLREEQETQRTPREKLRNQIEILLSHVYELREFLQRQIQEVAGKGFDTEVPEWLRRNNASFLRWFQVKMETLYGKDIVPYTGDLCIVGHGLIKSYIAVIFRQDTHLSLAVMADHLMNLLDIIVAGLLTSKQAPLINSTILASWMEENEESKRKNPLQIIKDMKTVVSKLDSIEPEESADLLESLNILEGEVLLPHPRKAIIQGMLSNLQSCSELTTPLEELRKLVTSFSNHSCLFR
ncbi:TetR/AcrR family transcriptional regulator [Paenibacillus sp. B2(2019)]|uniref:TetR/AcrR family transcriptional regulator n=1 Tax=Paenibacillus sp. B2(2019) TaxID=2607754 RepID=UPI0011F0E6B2|nr:TetR/AcrR family transcriptional regulator [Paenibacillus sp. B2(2019)]KAA1186967.1 TetR/AcrR family transcriptional regulator [Paenibacillus sp. B2(2019)]